VIGTLLALLGLLAIALAVFAVLMIAFVWVSLKIFVH
jgi:hypothetical protein